MVSLCIAYASVALLLAGTTGCSKRQPAHGEFLDRYLRQKEAIAACPDVACYRALARQYGSVQTITKVEASPDSVLQLSLDSDKDLVEPYLNRESLGEWSIQTEEVRDDKATLVISRVLPDQLDKTKPGYTVEAHWVRENGEWKVGK